MRRRRALLRARGGATTRGCSAPPARIRRVACVPAPRHTAGLPKSMPAALFGAAALWLDASLGSARGPALWSSSGSTHAVVEPSRADVRTAHVPGAAL